jgi:hypothetical protein
MAALPVRVGFGAVIHGTLTKKEDLRSNRSRSRNPLTGGGLERISPRPLKRQAEKSLTGWGVYPLLARPIEIQTTLNHEHYERPDPCPS